MNANHFFIFELGSTSLKFHFWSARVGRAQKLKLPWQVGYEVCRTGTISHRSMDRAVTVVANLLRQFGEDQDPQKTLAFGTGVFRDARNLRDFILKVWIQTGVKVWVISGDQEAALLQSLYLGRCPSPRSLAFDLGSGSLQWVHAGYPGKNGRGSIQLGVIRLLQSASDVEGNFSTKYAAYLADKHLAALPRDKPDELVGSGGTMKAIHKALGGGTLRREDLVRLRERVEKEGPPPGLKPHRLPLFLPGVTLVERILKDQGDPVLRYEELSVGEAMLAKVLPFFVAGKGARPTMVMKRIRFSEIVRAPASNGLDAGDTPGVSGAETIQP